MGLSESHQKKRRTEAPQMKYSYHRPIPKITEFVRTILVLDNHSAQKRSELPLFTNGMPALLYKSNNHITLFGQSVPDKEWRANNDETMIAFLFKPFALGTIFSLSAQDLKGKPVNLNLWNAKKAMALNVQLCQAETIQDKREVLSHFIFTQIKNNQRDCEIIRSATDAIMQNSKADVLPQIIKNLNVTERTFQRIFKKYVGITANEYRRICQYYFAFSQLKDGHFEKLTDVAFSNGYFDQSHFIRSFKKFAKTTPNQYLQTGLDTES